MQEQHHSPANTTPYHDGKTIRVRGVLHQRRSMCKRVKLNRKLQTEVGRVLVELRIKFY